MRAFTPKGWKRPILTSDNPKLKSWRQEVTLSALQASPATYVCLESRLKEILFRRPLAVKLSAVFYMPRPKSRKKAKHYTTRPDLSKLTRSLEDALTGVVWDDDSQVAQYGDVRKEYGEPPRTEVVVEELAE